eukprot:2471422-Alexandrium_andersonii.AAC.1
MQDGKWPLQACPELPERARTRLNAFDGAESAPRTLVHFRAAWRGQWASSTRHLWPPALCFGRYALVVCFDAILSPIPAISPPATVPAPQRPTGAQH